MNEKVVTKETLDLLQELVPKRNILAYEVLSSRWCPYISNNFLQELIFKYYANKVNKKYARYKSQIDFAKKKTIRAILRWKGEENVKA